MANLMWLLRVQGMQQLTSLKLNHYFKSRNCYSVLKKKDVLFYEIEATLLCKILR